LASGKLWLTIWRKVFSPDPNKDGSCATYKINNGDLCAQIAAAHDITVHKDLLGLYLVKSAGEIPQVVASSVQLCSVVSCIDKNSRKSQTTVGEIIRPSGNSFHVSPHAKAHVKKRFRMRADMKAVSTRADNFANSGLRLATILIALNHH
jgi:hypothetical protein